MIYSDNEKLIAKEKIKYFKILPSPIVEENGEGSKLRNYDYEPGTIIELRPEQLESELFSLERTQDSFSELFLQNMKHWDYRKPFDFYEWIKMQKPITFSQEGSCELYYERKDKILVGPWIKAKILQLFVTRKKFWDNRGQIVNNCKLLMYLVENGFIKNLNNPTNAFSKYTEQEILDAIMEKHCFKGMEDKEIYPFLYQKDFFRQAKIISGTQELYESDYNEEFIIPFYKDETWDVTENRELLLGILNQSFYEMLVRNAREIGGSEKDCLFEEEFGNRIKMLKDRYGQMHYQAIDDQTVTKKLLDLKQAGYNISFDEYNPKHCYPNGNIKYFSCFYRYYEEKEQKETIDQLAEQLTDLQAKTVFPEDFYFGRAYYQMREQGKDVDDFELNVKYCEKNPDNFYADGSLKYFWVDYLGEMGDFSKREKILEFADELSVSKAIELKKADELVEYQHEMRKKEEEKIEKFMSSSSFSKKYRKAVKKIENGEVPNEREFAKKQIEQNKKYLRQKRLDNEKRVRKLTLNEMIEELETIEKGRYNLKDKMSEELYWKLYDQEIDFDDVIQLLSDVILTEEEAKCVAIAWPLTKRIDYITDENMTSQQIQELFPELHENTEIHKKSAEIIARFYHSYTEKQKQRQAENLAKKLKTFQSITAEKDEVEL